METFINYILIVLEMSWREKVDPIIKTYLELQIKDTAQFRESFSKAKDPSKAQLWIAIANLSKHIFSLEMKIKYLEKTLQELAMFSQAGKKNIPEEATQSKKNKVSKAKKKR